MYRISAFAACIAAGLIACGSTSPESHTSTSGAGGATNTNEPVAQSAACNDPNQAKMPATPAQGQFRSGLSCSIYIDSADFPGETIAFQVFEPSTLVGGQTYPIILEGHGFSGSRQGANTSNARLLKLLDEGYRVVSIDQAGHGETGGLIRVMDPDQEGKFLVTILDWIDQNLDWRAIGPDLDAGENNTVLGAMGSSYGGGYQHILQAVDPEKRLDALVPEITWHDLSYSLFPNTVVKGTWASVLFAAGNSAGGGGNFDPYISNLFAAGLAANRADQDALDFFRYHGPGYFCDGIPVATNGGPNTAPELRDPVPPMTAVHTLYFQGFRDPLFNYNEAFHNYQCMNNKTGADVRLFSYQSGHNTIEVVIDRPLSQPANNSLISSCGDISADDAAIAWFNRFLKGDTNALSGIIDDHEICFSLSGNDAVFADNIISGTAGSAFDIAHLGAQASLPVTVTPGKGEAPTAVSLHTVAAGGDILAGIPHVEIAIEDPSGVGSSDGTIIFVSVGHMGARTGFQWERVDNQVTPIRGLYSSDDPLSIELIGVAERLEAGDQVGLLFYGLQTNQYATTGSRPADNPATLVQISGTAYLPLLSAQD